MKVGPPFTHKSKLLKPSLYKYFVGRSRYAAGKKTKTVYNSYICPIPGSFLKEVYHLKIVNR